MYVSVCMCVSECGIEIIVQVHGGMTSPVQLPRGQMSSVACWCGSETPLGLFISGKFNPNNFQPASILHTNTPEL